MIQLDKLFIMLKKHGLLTQLETINDLALDKHPRPHIALVESGLVGQSAMTKILAEYLDIPLIHASDFPFAMVVDVLLGFV